MDHKQKIADFLKDRDEACGTIDADDAEREESADMILDLLRDTPPTDRPLTADAMKLRDCPPGLFMFGETMGLKTKYKAMEPVGPTEVPGYQVRWKVGTHTEAYVAESGEVFWGGATSKDERENLLVRPVSAAPPPAREEAPGYQGPGTEPHKFSADLSMSGMGDCMVCGHTEEAHREEAPANTGSCPCGLKADDCHPDCPHGGEEAPAEGAGERLLREAAEKFRYYEASHRAKKTDEATAKAEVNAEISGRIEAHLRARTSEPARGAVACVIAFRDGKREPDLLSWNKLSIGEHRLYTHPAPATADKLRVAVGLLNDCIWLDTDTGDYRVEHDGSVEKARAILATLNEEGNA